MRTSLALVVSDVETGDFVTAEAKFVSVDGKGATFALTKSCDPDLLLATDARWLDEASLQTLRGSG